MAKYITNACVGKKVTNALNRDGFDVVYVPYENKDLARESIRTGRVVITSDRRFLETIGELREKIPPPVIIPEYARTSWRRTYEYLKEILEK